jgi:hypothetical protein
MSKYDDIINMEHPTSATRPRMSLHDRAAQFAPFPALTGHSALIKETARVTSKRITLDDYAIEELNAKLTVIAEHPDSNAVRSITYFVPDMHKDGGAYVTVTDKLKRIDPYEQIILTKGGTRINISDVIDISDAPCVNTDY